MSVADSIRHPSSVSPSRLSPSVRSQSAERAKILAAAKREGLSGPAAAKKFGISHLIFYTWRRKSGTSTTKQTAGRPRGTITGRDGLLSGDIGERIRKDVRTRVSEMLPEIIQTEIDSILGHSTARRRTR